jgi:hypothetical protein
VKTKTKTQPKRDDRAFIDSAPEVSVFMCCFGLVNEVKKLQAAGRWDTSDTYCKDVIGQLCCAAEATWRFDVVVPVAGYGRLTSVFWRWFCWWDDYLRSLSQTELFLLEQMVMQRDPRLAKRLVDYRPQGHWLCYRAAPMVIVEQ